MQRLVTETFDSVTISQHVELRVKEHLFLVAQHFGALFGVVMQNRGSGYVGAGKEELPSLENDFVPGGMQRV